MTRNEAEALRHMETPSSKLRSISGENTGKIPGPTMIRRDYILRMIEEFIRALVRMRGLKKAGRWDEAAQAVDLEFKKLLDGGASAVIQLSEKELLAQLSQADGTA